MVDKLLKGLIGLVAWLLTTQFPPAFGSEVESEVITGAVAAVVVVVILFLAASRPPTPRVLVARRPLLWSLALFIFLVSAGFHLAMLLRVSVGSPHLYYVDLMAYGIGVAFFAAGITYVGCLLLSKYGPGK